MSKSILNVIQCNCQRAYAVMCDIGSVMCEHRISVALLQEPYVKDGCVRGLPMSMDVFACDSGPVKAAVVVNDPNLNVMCVSECTNEYGVCVWLKGDFGELYVVSVYCRFGEDIEPYLLYLDTVRDTVRGKRLLIGMDANAVSPLWFSKGSSTGADREARGRILEEWIVVNEMIVLNEPSEYFTFSGSNGESDIDVTLVNEECSRCRFEWNVKCNWGISDHNTLLICMIYNVENRNDDATIMRKWIWTGVDWEGYMTDLRERAVEYSVDMMDEMSVEKLLETVMSWILHANDSRMKKYKRKCVGKLIWWTDELERLKKRVRKYRRIYQHERKRNRGCIDEKLANYRRAVRDYKKELWNAKEANWKRFVRTTGNKDPWGEVYRVCMGKYGNKRMSGMKVDNRVTCTWKESVDVLMERFFPAARMNMRTVSSGRCVSRNSFEWDEVDGAVKSMKLRKAPGLDGICAEMLRVIWRAIPECLKRIYDLCLSTNCFPAAWKAARLIVLLKSPDKVRSDPGSYRPICLLSVFGKVLERMMVNRLERKMCGKMCDMQFGFMRGRSTEDAWNRATEWVNDSDKKYVLGVFVDFKGAFDNLEWNCVLEKLREIGCEELGLWESYFSERKVCMVGENEIIWKDVRRGCPQGSVCGPFVWNLMLDDLLWRLCERECKVVAYADDLLLMVEGQNRVELERKGTEWMKIVSAWSEKVGVSVSESKTVMMFLKGRMAGSRHPNVRVNGKCMKYVKCVKYLGIWMSERMNFKVHLERLRVKCMNVVGKLRRVMKCDWGLRKKAMRTIYKGLFTACVMYGASVWHHMMQFGYGRSMINSCQRVALCACLNVCRTVSTEAMQVLIGELPWDLECVQRGTMFRIKHGLRLRSDIVSDQDVYGLDANKIKSLVNDRLYAVWQERWNESERGRVTYEFIKNVRFAEKLWEFEPALYVGYILTGHGSLNAFLYKRGLSETASCICGAEREDWKHVLVECMLYADARNLDEWGVIVSEDGNIDVSGVLECKDRYERVCEFAVCAFRRRKSQHV